MKSSRVLLAFMTSKRWIVLLLILFSTSKSKGQKDTQPAGMLCVSDCDTCPVVCSPPLSTPKPPPQPPAALHHSPPEPPAHPPPSASGAVPPPPALYVYNPGTMQQNFSYPYYYFYSSKATCSLPLHQGFFLFALSTFFQVLYACR